MKTFSSFSEDLRKWFDPSHPEGGWKRINSKGEAIGPCAREPGEPKPKCMSNEKRASLSKKERAAAVRAKRKHDPNAERKGKPISVSNFGKGKLSENMANLEEENKPTNPELWARAKSLAKQKFDVYPSAYANGWAAKWYKSKGGGWKSVNEAVKMDYDEQIEKIAKKHKVSVDTIKDQLKMGVKIEKEHTTDTATATKIALDHLDEFSDYYTKLKAAEKQMKEEVEKIREAAKWRSSSVAKKVTDPEGDDSVSYDYHYDNPRSTGMKRASSDTLEKYSSLSTRPKAQIASSGARKGMITKQHGERLKARIKAGLHGEEVEQIDEISQETRHSYIHKAKKEIEQLKPHAKEGEYKDIASNIMKRRHAGVKKAIAKNLMSFKGRLKEDEELDEATYGMNDHYSEITHTEKQDDKTITIRKPKYTKNRHALFVNDKYHSVYGSHEGAKSNIDRLKKEDVNESRGHKMIATKLANMERMKSVKIPTPQERREMEAKKKEQTKPISEGRLSQRHPLEGHEYHKKSDAELTYIAKDAHKAAEAMKGHNTQAENKYRDQANDSATVRYWRQKNGMPTWYKKKYGHMKEEVQFEEQHREEGRFKPQVPRNVPNTQTPKPQHTNVVDKSGAVHTPMSRAKHLARLAMKKYTTENTELSESRKTEIVKDIIKKKKSENDDKFQKEPIITDTLVKGSNY